jgi:uncharacterized protein
MTSPNSTPAQTPPVELGPTTSADRIVLLDALRGFAVCGILFANIGYFSGYEYLSASARATFASADMDHVMEFIARVLIEGKFYSLFAMMFGIGFATQLMRAQEIGSSGSALFRRRLFGLLLIGVAHSVLLWFGDILTLYALIGFALVPFWRCSDRAVLRWALVLLLLPVIQYAVMMTLLGGSGEGGASIDTTRSQFDSLVAVFGTGDYAQIIVNNTRANLVGRIPNLLFTGRLPSILGMFLIGLYLGRQRLPALAGSHRSVLVSVAIAAIGLGLIGNVAFALLAETGAFYGLQPLGLLQSAVDAVAVPVLCLGYAAAFATLFQNHFWRAPLLVFAPLGRVALSAYLSQTLICVFIFYGFGLGFYSHVGRAPGLLMAAAICLVQIAMAHAWLKYMRFGPAEWAWRSFTYRRLQPWVATSGKPFGSSSALA